MKQLETNELESLIGGGCGKYLRRSERATRRGDDEVAKGNLRQWYDCVGAEMGSEF